MLAVRRNSSKARTAIGLAVVLLAGATAGAKDEWKKKPAAQWTREEAVEFFTKSPWAKDVEVWQLTGRRPRKTVREGTPGVTVGMTATDLAPEQVEARYRVSWSSAELVREGWERLEQLDAALAEQFEPPESSPGRHIVTVRVAQPPEGTPVIFAGLVPAELSARATLRSSKKATVTSEQAVVHGTGAAMAVSFYFPREVNGAATLPARTAWAEFVFQGPKGDKLKARFKMKEMVYQGKADY